MWLCVQTASAAYHLLLSRTALLDRPFEVELEQNVDTYCLVQGV